MLWTMYLSHFNVFEPGWGEWQVAEQAQLAEARKQQEHKTATGASSPNKREKDSKIAMGHEQVQNWLVKPQNIRVFGVLPGNLTEFCSFQWQSCTRDTFFRNEIGSWGPNLSKTSTPSSEVWPDLSRYHNQRFTTVVFCQPQDVLWTCLTIFGFPKVPQNSGGLISFPMKMTRLFWIYQNSHQSPHRHRGFGIAHRSKPGRGTRDCWMVFGVPDRVEATK